MLEPRRLLAVTAWVPQNPIGPLENDLPKSIAAADIDGDADLDIVFASDSHTEGGVVGWYENLGGALFGPQQILVSDVYRPHEVLVQDVDGDGALDVVYTNEDHELYWLMQLPEPGRFRFQGRIGTSGAPAVIDLGRYTIAASDFNSDGRLDFVVPDLSSNVVSYVQQQPGGNWATTVVDSNVDANSASAADIDGDGDLDIVVSSYEDSMIVWYENDLANPFSERHEILGPPKPAWVTAGDLDKDGRTDLVALSVFDTRWYRNVGAGEFEVHELSPLFALPPVLTDLNGDGHLDVLAGTWLPGGPDGPTGQPLRGPSGTQGILSVGSGDIDGDGDLDIVSASYFDNRLAWYPNDGNAAFGVGRVISGDVLGPTKVRAADLDSDGDLDVVAADLRSNKVVWYENVNGLGSYSTQRIIADSVFERPSALAVLDADQDGDPDILASYATQDVLVAYLNEQDGRRFSGPLMLATSPNIVDTQDHHEIVSGDMNGDGLVDLVWGVAASGKVYLLEGTATGFLPAVLLAFGGFSPRVPGGVVRARPGRGMGRR